MEPDGTGKRLRDGVKAGAGLKHSRSTAAPVLTINGGSSSVRFAVFEFGVPPQRVLSGQIERIGLTDPVLNVTQDNAHERLAVAASNHATAAGTLTDWLRRRIGDAAFAAIGHRIVHGGPRYSRPELVTPELLAELRRISSWDPNHLPSQIAMVEAFATQYPGLRQFACFDTAFHREMPRVAKIIPLPRRFEGLGVQRYGFHGLSYTFVLQELERIAGSASARGRVVIAHLGNGASLAAIRDGKCVDTSMGFTPASGVPMGTRSGDIDPGLVRFLMARGGMSTEQFDNVVNHQSGLLGVSETSSDMRDLLACENDDFRAREAVQLSCYQVKKWIGAFAAALGGLDTLVFTGGIGEHAPVVRSRICEGLEFLSIQLDGARNGNNAPVISADASRVTVRVIPTDEERVIAEAVWRMLSDVSVGG